MAYFSFEIFYIDIYIIKYLIYNNNLVNYRIFVIKNIVINIIIVLNAKVFIVNIKIVVGLVLKIIKSDKNNIHKKIDVI